MTISVNSTTTSVRRARALNGLLAEATGKIVFKEAQRLPKRVPIDARQYQRKDMRSQKDVRHSAVGTEYERAQDHKEDKGGQDEGPKGSRIARTDCEGMIDCPTSKGGGHHFG